MHSKSITHRERVYEIAAGFLFQGDVDSWNMDMLAREAGVTKRTLYKIVPSKEELVKELVFRAIVQAQEELSGLLHQDGDYLETLETIADSYSQVHEKTTSAAMGKIMKDYPSIEKMIIERRHEMNEEFIRFFQRGMDEGYLQNTVSPDYLIEILQALILYFVQAAESSEEFMQKLTTSFRIVLNGLRRQKGPCDSHL